MGRKPSGAQAMSQAERAKLYRQNMSAQKKLDLHKLRGQKLKERCNADHEYREKILKSKRKSIGKARGQFTSGESQFTPNDASTPKVSVHRLSTIRRSEMRLETHRPKDTSLDDIITVRAFERKVNETVGLTPSKQRKIREWTNAKVPGKSGRPVALSPERKIKLLQFLSQQDMCYHLPGRNNQVYIGRKDGKCIYKPKLYMLWTLREIMGILERDGGTELSDIKFSTMYRYIKSQKQLVLQNKIPGVSCLCPDCENLELKCKHTNRCCKTDLPTSIHDLMPLIACNPITEECAAGSCARCPQPDLTKVEETQSVKYHVWAKDPKPTKQSQKCKSKDSKESKSSYPEKKLVEISGPEMAEKLRSEFNAVRAHYYRKRTQSNMYKEHIADLKRGEAVVHIDYSENYKNKQQDEVKAAYFGQGQFSLYTACVYMKSPDSDEIISESLVYVTPENDHSSNVSYALNKLIVEKLKTQMDLKKVKFWSDGCSSQFRSQYAFYMLTKFRADIDVEWHYFEANHGKGAVDGIGGIVKHAVWRRVLSKQVVIETPQQFAEYANKVVKGIEVIYAGSSDLDLSYFDEARANAKPVTDTLKVHCIQRSVEESMCHLQFRITSRSPSAFTYISYPIFNDLTTPRYYTVKSNKRPAPTEIPSVRIKLFK